EILDLLLLVAVRESDPDRPSVTLDARGPDLRLAELAFDILTDAIDGVVDRLLDVDAVEEVRPALQIEAETHGLLPRPPRRRGTHECRHEEDDRGHRQPHEERQPGHHRAAHDFSRSFSRGSAG